MGTRSQLETSAGRISFLRLGKLAEDGLCDLDRTPITIKVLLENVLRQVGSPHATEADVAALAAWSADAGATAREFPYAPSRVLLQDFTGVPAVVDLAAMRSALDVAGIDPSRVDPQVPVELVIDHSVQVDAFGAADALERNVSLEYHRNSERYLLLRWAQQAFNGFRAVPPGMGIVHQVNLEFLAQVVRTVDDAEGTLAIPDTLVGTDSHTPMVNGLGVLGWGVGGIEAEAAMLGQPIPQVTPKVVGCRLTGELGAGVTATDLVLTITELLRSHGVVGKFVEFTGDGISALTVPDRATLSNMTPEYGATACLWPIDAKTLDYMRLTNRPAEVVERVERYAKENGMFHTAEMTAPAYSEAVELDLASVVPSLAGPSRPQDRVRLSDMATAFTKSFPRRSTPVPASFDGADFDLGDASVVIAAITSCTNTSNPAVMLAAGLVAKKAVEHGLTSKPWVKTSLAPGSRVVTEYLDRAGLTPYLEQLGFFTVGYGCTTCIGNSGPLPEPIAAAITAEDLTVAAVLSGNRNFEGRIHPLVRASYLASPPLVVAFALAGRADIDLTTEAVATAPDGTAVMLSDLWPDPEELADAMGAVTADEFRETYSKIFDGDARWRDLDSPTGDLFAWAPDSTYVREPDFFTGIGTAAPAPADVVGARALALLGDSVTTDHISPAGSIAKDSPAAEYLTAHGVAPADFNSYGSRRGNHEVMVRGTFANIRLRNALAGGKEGGWTSHQPGGELMSIYDAAMAYAADAVPLVVIGGKEYGSGSSRDWAAKGTRMLGVKAVIAESFERIHRSNLVGMGVLPLQFAAGDSASSLGLDGTETYDITGISGGLTARQTLHVTATRADGTASGFDVECRVDSEVEVAYMRDGGVLQYVLRGLAGR
ncbi:MAG: aconitate hydratase AcnA [Acidimicrobiia bacterium]|nr:aconitate hydratase AcnA [Acidimicrobiia bacterium]